MHACMQVIKKKKSAWQQFEGLSSLRESLLLKNKLMESKIKETKEFHSRYLQMKNINETKVFINLVLKKKCRLGCFYF